MMTEASALTALEKVGMLEYKLKEYERFKRHVDAFLDRAERKGEIEKIIKIFSALFRKEYEITKEVFEIRAEIEMLLGKDLGKYKLLIEKEKEIFSNLSEKIKNLLAIEKNKKYN